MHHQVSELQAANEAATQCRKHKRKQLQKEGTLTVEEGLRLTTQKEFEACSNGERAERGGTLMQVSQLKGAVDAAARLDTMRAHASK